LRTIRTLLYCDDAGRHHVRSIIRSFQFPEGFMRTHRPISLLAALVTFGGSAYLATPAEAEPVQACAVDSWYAAAKTANEACGGPASFTGRCENGTFVLETIYCQSSY
jgi:hypothetical protein